jgi:hypothetical protein
MIQVELLDLPCAVGPALVGGPAAMLLLMPDQVFLDAQIIKFSTESVLLRPKAQPEVIEWGGQTLSVPVQEFVTHRWRDKLEGDIRNETDLLPDVAALAGKGRVSFVTDGELDMEVWGLPGSFGRRTVMSGAKIERVPPPFEYSRVVSGPSGSFQEHRSDFIRSVNDPRFLELAKACGAFDGSEVGENQLWDAFHLWTAERSGVPFFLTVDFKLIRRTATAPKSGPRTTLLRPSELLARYP